MRRRVAASSRMNSRHSRSRHFSTRNVAVCQSSASGMSVVKTHPPIPGGLDCGICCGALSLTDAWRGVRPHAFPFREAACRSWNRITPWTVRSSRRCRNPPRRRSRLCSPDNSSSARGWIFGSRRRHVSSKPDTIIFACGSSVAATRPGRMLVRNPQASHIVWSGWDFCSVTP